MRIDPQSHVPIYAQIVGLMRSSIAAGVYKPGEMLPSLRVLAVELRVNPNTVQKAYDELEREGLTRSRRGVGMFVAQGGVSSAQSQAERTVAELFQQAVRAARAAELPADRIRAIYEEVFLGESDKKAKRR